ncbi:hypothetical protein FVE85_2462 [Porphyridium purpureum]|uniref:Uncharacterized protein n=1 Tax=Porphyridium purpureum TaxID=35688 RepID=A0A5J4YM27_PORPP|nr:hypothetical protein FVE85_2462 [Porphyridium purpureum]|eukprot:POR0127..scf291_13
MGLDEDLILACLMVPSLVYRIGSVHVLFVAPQELGLANAGIKCALFNGVASFVCAKFSLANAVLTAETVWMLFFILPYLYSEQLDRAVAIVVPRRCEVVIQIASSDQRVTVLNVSQVLEESDPSISPRLLRGMEASDAQQIALSWRTNLFL